MGLFHITTRQAWEAARAAGAYRPPSLELEGFIHLSSDRQLLVTANRWFRGQPDLVVLTIRADRLAAEVRWEAAHGELFPHLYGALPLAAVVDVFALPVAADGAIELPVELAPWRHYFD